MLALVLATSAQAQTYVYECRNLDGVIVSNQLERCAKGEKSQRFVVKPAPSGESGATVFSDPRSSGRRVVPDNSYIQSSVSSQKTSVRNPGQAKLEIPECKGDAICEAIMAPSTRRVRQLERELELFDLETARGLREIEAAGKR